VPADVDVAQLRRLLKVGGYARATLGVVMLLTPGLIGGMWIGADAKRRGVKALTRALGIRELIIGAGAVVAANEGTQLRRWVEFGMVADATDAAATFVAVRHLPRANAVLGVVAASSGAVAGAWLLTQLPEETPSR